MKVFICDAGAFGTAMAVVLARAGHEVTLLIQPYDYLHLELLIYLRGTGKNRTGKRENDLHLPGIELPPNISFTVDFGAIKDSDAVFLAVPSKFVWSAFLRIINALKTNPKAILTLLTKGLDSATAVPLGVRMSDYLAEHGKYNFVVVSGGTPAQAIVNKYRAFAVSVAGRNISAINTVKKLFLGSNIGVIGTTDVTGVSFGGALKNAYAVKYGMLEGEGEKDLASQYLDQFALSEMKLFLDSAGANPETLESPAVKGDFRVTCLGYLDWESRNVSFGKFLAKKPSKKDISEYISKNTVEGYESALILRQIAVRNNLNTPFLNEICDAVTGAP